MDGTIVASGTLPSFEFVSIKYAHEILHRIKVTDTINLQNRLPLYRETLSINETNNYFCILDNSGGYENKFSYSDIVILDDILIRSGIKYFYGATITTDGAYQNLVKLATHNAQASKLGGELLATDDPDEAEKFIMEKIRSICG